MYIVIQLAYEPNNCSEPGSISVLPDGLFDSVDSAKFFILNTLINYRKSDELTNFSDSKKFDFEVIEKENDIYLNCYFEGELYNRYQFSIKFIGPDENMFLINEKTNFKDIDFLSEIIKNWLTFVDLPNGFIKDKEVALLISDSNGFEFNMLDESLRNDPEILAKVKRK